MTAARVREASSAWPVEPSTLARQVTVTKADGKITVTLAAGFSLDDAPDAYVALGSGAKPVAGGVLAKLKTKTGAQTYSIATSAALEGASQVIIWCKQYSVPLGAADLK